MIQQPNDPMTPVMLTVNNEVNADVVKAEGEMCKHLFNKNFRNDSGGASIADCWACPAGYYCDQPGLSEPTGLCSERYLCIKGSTSPTPTNSSTGYKCPMGGFCPPGALSGKMKSEIIQICGTSLAQP